METSNDSCKRLIGAILEQALADAQSSARECEPEGARRFINVNNKLFVHYCDLLDVDPEYIAKGMQAQIKENIQAKKDKQNRIRDAMYFL